MQIYVTGEKSAEPWVNGALSAGLKMSDCIYEFVAAIFQHNRLGDYISHVDKDIWAYFDEKTDASVGN